MDKKATKVTVSIGYTLNTGDYESLRLNIGVEDESRRMANGEFETVEATFDRVYGFVERKLEDKLLETKAQFEKKGII